MRLAGALPEPVQVPRSLADERRGARGQRLKALAATRAERDDGSRRCPIAQVAQTLRVQFGQLPIEQHDVRRRGVQVVYEIVHFWILSPTTWKSGFGTSSKGRAACTGCGRRSALARASRQDARDRIVDGVSLRLSGSALTWA